MHLLLQIVNICEFDNNAKELEEKIINSNLS